jgi:hypothetical protein
MSDLTQKVVTRQAEAMGVDIFEVGLYKPAVEGKPNEPEMLPRTWDKATLLRSVGWLKHQNSHGRNIYIRPKGEHHLSLVDDLTGEAIQRMKSEGFQPAVVVETSPGNFQAWLNHGRILSRAESTSAARTLAEKFGGDRGAADWRHFGRLSAFTNRKRKYQTEGGLYPFVRLIESSGVSYGAADQFVRQVQTRLEEERSRREEACRSATQCRQATEPITIENFRSNPAYGGDGTRIDLAYAIYALAHGGSESQVRDSLQSRDLSHKGNERRRHEYVERTLKKASAIIAGRVCAR